MISAFRRSLDTWVVRGFFMIMVLAFLLWGVGDVLRLVGTSTWVAKIGDRTIEAPAFQADFQRNMATATRGLPPGQEATPELRRQVGDDTMRRLVAQTAIGMELRDMRIVTPEASVLDTARAIPAFRGPDGQFSKAAYDAVLRNNGLTEGRFLDMLRGDLSQRQLVGTVSAGATAPSTLVLPLYATEFEKRAADMVELPISAAPEPPTPDAAVLQRWYDNHPDSYTSPEYRRIRVVVLSPQLLGKDLPITDEEVKAAFEQHRSEYETEAKRSFQVISAPGEAKAASLAALWRGGADWAAMQKAAQEQGASAVSLDDATENQVPDPDLGKAVFAATPDTVSAPVHGALGWFVTKVTHAQGGSAVTFDQVKDKVRERLAAEKGTELMYDRANKIDAALANGGGFDELPGDLGLVGMEGTLDAAGKTLEGEAAPVPGASELRKAVIDSAFQTQKGDPPRLTEVQTPSVGGSAYYAVSVEDVLPPSVKPLEEVRDRVLADWSFDERRHTQETAAASVLTAVKAGQSLADAGTVAGVSPHISPLVTRSQQTEGVPPELQRVLFTLKKNEPTMVETPEGFVVAVLAEVVEPDPKADQAGIDQARTAVKQSIRSDLDALFTDALRQRAAPRINQKNLDQIVQP